MIILFWYDHHRLFYVTDAITDEIMDLTYEPFYIAGMYPFACSTVSEELFPLYSINLVCMIQNGRHFADNIFKCMQYIPKLYLKWWHCFNSSNQ